MKYCYGIQGLYGTHSANLRGTGTVLPATLCMVVTVILFCNVHQCLRRSWKPTGLHTNDCFYLICDLVLHIHHFFPELAEDDTIDFNRVLLVGQLLLTGTFHDYHDPNLYPFPFGNLVPINVVSQWSRYLLSSLPQTTKTSVPF
jgi:hypothetical protein